MRTLRMPRRPLLVALIAILSTLGFAFAASITMPAATNSGYGAMTVSGYTLSGITYTLNTANPGLIDNVGFKLALAGGGDAPETATNVQARMYLGGPWISCTGVTASHVWVCPGSGVTGATVTQTLQLDVAAAAK
jgi:hypothetical protein